MSELKPGDVAPVFTLPTVLGGELNLTDLRGKSVIVFAYPAAMTPGCTLEARDFAAAYDTLRAAGYEVVGISPDPLERNQEFATALDLPYHVVSDVDREVLDAWGIWGPKNVFGKTVLGVRRSTFVLDAQGVVTIAQYAVRATGHVDRLLKEIGIA